MNQKSMESKLFELQSEKNTFEHRMLLDETKFRELCQRLNDSQVRNHKIIIFPVHLKIMLYFFLLN